MSLLRVFSLCPLSLCLLSTGCTADFPETVDANLFALGRDQGTPFMQPDAQIRLDGALDLDADLTADARPDAAPRPDAGPGVPDARPMPDAQPGPDARPMPDPDAQAPDMEPVTPDAAVVGPPPMEGEVQTDDPAVAGGVGGQGGDLFNDLCPENEVMVGLIGSEAPEGWIRRLKIQCAQAVLRQDQEGWGLDLEPTILVPEDTFRGGNGPLGRDGASRCPRHQAVVGFESNAGGLVDALIVRCAPLRLVPGQDDLWQVTPEAGRLVGEALGNDAGGDPQPVVNCPAGAFAVGAAVRAGDDIDRFGLLCAQATFEGD